MFRKSDHRRRSSNPLTGAVRLIMSLIIMAVLGFGFLLAYKSFSGVDPLQVSPQNVFKSMLTSEGAYNFIIGLLNFNPSSSLSDAKKLLGEEGSGAGGGARNGPVKFRFAVLGDSHKDTTNLSKALNQAKQAGAKFVVGLGDLSDVGTIDELRNSKQQFDSVDLPYYTTPGDHDLWDARNKKLNPVQNFTDVFGQPYQSFSYDGVRFIVYYNSDNYLGVDDLQLKFLEDESRIAGESDAKLIFTFSSTPLYHPSSDHVMGKVTPRLKNQADHLLSLFKKNGVDEVFAADTHFFSRYKDPVNNLPITNIGALSSDRNPQSPRFALVDVYEDGGYNVLETEVK